MAQYYSISFCLNLFASKKVVCSKKIGNNTTIEKTKTKKGTIRFYEILQDSIRFEKIWSDFTRSDKIWQVLIIFDKI